MSVLSREALAQPQLVFLEHFTETLLSVISNNLREDLSNMHVHFQKLPDLATQSRFKYIIQIFLSLSARRVFHHF